MHRTLYTPFPTDDELTAYKKTHKIESKVALTDDEIRAKRLFLEKRRSQLESAWQAIDFSQTNFEELLDYASNTKSKSVVPQRKFLVAAAQGYLYSLDPHSSLVSAAAWEESTRNTTDSSFEGIGAVLTQRDNLTIVESPIEGRPAFEAVSYTHLTLPTTPYV